jgi:hypothetical protein
LPPFPADLWLVAAKQLLDAARTTIRWLDQYQPPSQAESGELQIRIFPEKPTEPNPETS